MFSVTVPIGPASEAGMRRPGEQGGEQVAGEVTDEVTGEVAGEVRLLAGALEGRAMTRTEAQKALGLKGQANFRDRYLVPVLSAGLVEMTIPGKPQSCLQKYRLTDKGRRILAQNEGA